MRLRKRPWTLEEIKQYSSFYIEDPETQKGKWSEMFGNSNPIYIEVGTGRGRFITTLAKQNREINYIAIEQKQEVLVQAVRQANNLGLTNIKFLLNNASLLQNFFNQKEVSRIYLNFSDPWPKKRHAKRRLTHKRFLDVYKNILADKGEIHFKTDNELLFEFSLNELNMNGFSLQNISLNLYRDEDNINAHVQTEYEQKFIRQGKPIYRLEGVLI